MIERLIDLDVGISKYFSYVVMWTPIARNQAPLEDLFTR